MAKGKSPRRWNSERYPKMVTVRVTEEEHRGLTERAARSGLSTSRYLVRCGLGLRLPALRDAYPPNPDERRHLVLLLAELRKVGTNLNQLARRSNRARLFRGFGPPKSQIERASGQAGALIRLLRHRL